MLTERALYERKWREFPELGKLLDHKQLGIHWTGPTSVSDTIFAQITRPLEIYALVTDNSEEIERSMNVTEHRLREELYRLSDGLSWAAEQLTEASRSVEKVARRG